MAKRIVDEEMRFTVIINGNEAQKELFDLEKSTKSLTATNKQLRAERAKLQKSGKRNTAEYKKLTQEIKANSTTIGVNKTRMAALQKQIGITGLTMGQLRKKASMLRLQLNNMVPGSALFKKFEAELKAVNTRLTQLRGNAKATESSLSRVAGGFNKFQAVGFAAIAMLTGFVLSLQKVIDFNGKLADAMSNVQKTTGLTKEEVDDLTKSFGLLQTRTNRIDLLKIAEQGGRIGIVKEEIKDFVRVMNVANVALGDSFTGGVEEVAAKLGKLKFLFKETKDLKVDEAYNSIGSALNELGASGNSTEANITEFALRLGALPDALKPSITETLALGAVFEESGVQAEIAARAYSIFVTKAANNTEKFAEVMGLSKEQVEEMINTDPLKFFLDFSKGLQGMDATDVAETLKYLGVNATGVQKALGAAANNADRFAEQQNLANKAASEGVSLLKEYNIKNNNLAGTLDKVGKKLKSFLTSGSLNKALESLATGFGKLIGAIKDVNKEFNSQTEITFKTAQSNRKLANESQNLLNRYEELTKDGIKPTTEAKDELDIITLQLKDRLGESVLAIDAETGAFILNTEAVRKQIKLKRLSADEEASTLASRLVGATEELKLLKIQETQAQNTLRLRKKAFEDLNDGRSFAFGVGSNSSVPGFKEAAKAFDEVRRIQEEIITQKEREIDLTKKLKELNFSAADALNLINPTNPNTPEGPQDGAEKTINGVKYIFRNGNWVRKFKVPTTPTTGGALAKDPTLALLRKNLDLKNQLIQDDFERELAILETNSKRKIAKLREQLIDESNLKGTELAKAKFTNRAINDQILLEAQIFQDKQETIALKYIDKDLQNLTAKYDQEAKIRRAAFELELAQMDITDEERKAKQEEFDTAELISKAEHTQEVIDKVKAILASEEFEGIDLEFLTEEQKQELEKRLEDLGLKLSDIKKILAAIKGEDALGSIDGGNNFDIFGFTVDQWQKAFTNLDTLEGKLQAAAMGVQGLMNTYQFLYNLQSQNEERNFKQFDRYNTAQRTKLSQRLDAGIISQRQYDAALRALDKQKAEMEYQAAKRAHKNAVTQAIGNTALAVINGLMSTPFMPLGIAMGALAGILGGIQIAAVSKNKPVKGFERGYGYGNLPVQREQDGKLFNADFGGEARSGFVDKPTVFMAGEQGKNFPELIVSGPDLKKFNPAVTQSLANELARVRGFESGYTGSAVPQATAPASQDNEALMSLVAQNTAVLADLRDKGVIALLSRDMENTQLLKEDLDKLKKYRNKSAI